MKIKKPLFIYIKNLYNLFMVIISSCLINIITINFKSTIANFFFLPNIKTLQNLFMVFIYVVISSCFINIIINFKSMSVHLFFLPNIKTLQNLFMVLINLSNLY